MDTIVSEANDTMIDSIKLWFTRNKSVYYR